MIIVSVVIIKALFWVSVGSKLLSNMILFRLRDAVDNVLREKQYLKQVLEGYVRE